MEPLQQPGLSGGFVAFDCELGLAPLERVYCLLFNWNEEGTDQTNWEQSTHVHEVPRLQGNQLPATVWLFQGSARAVAADPVAQQLSRLRIHLVTAVQVHASCSFGMHQVRWSAQYRSPAMMRRVLSGTWILPVATARFFNSSFRRPVGRDWMYEPDYANRVWVAQDGSRFGPTAREVLSAMPIKRQFILHFQQEIEAAPQHACTFGRRLGFRNRRQR